MKSGSFADPPKKKIYRGYKNFDIEKLRNIFRENLERAASNSYKNIENRFLNVLDSYASLKAKMLRFSNSCFMNSKRKL